ncbi:FimV family protein [Methylobacter sp. S3L5C]|uniref:type IV pilus assembly protein FimV n=1 Tax=Methylobacter sp. S3L5C TaxID=2839024 RepID=UPI001FADCFEF|nr:hypothetical protein [Methylobacter sp. S3L5C]UOA08772.1 hypothetical protein KKZ03_00135 [Methylobacter sp. S3L5C]
MHSNIFIKTLALLALLLPSTAWSLEGSDIQTRSALEQKSTNGIQLQLGTAANLKNKQQENADKTQKPEISGSNEAVEDNAVVGQKTRLPKRSTAVKRSNEKDASQQITTVTTGPAIITEDKAASNKALEMEAHLKQLEQQLNTLQNVQNVQKNADKAAEPTTPILEAVLQPYILPAVAFIIGVISLLGWQKWRKRKPKKSFYTQTAKNSPSSESVDATPIPAIKAEATLEFLAELNILNANQNAVNLLTEVDIYISHGYYQKAEELLRRAMQQQPVRDEYKLKLLKTYYTSGNKSQFANYINELDDAGKLKEHPFWNNIADMVKVLIPDSPLLTSHKSAISGQKQQDLNERVAQEILDDELEYDFDFSEPPITKKYNR